MKLFSVKVKYSSKWHGYDSLIGMTIITTGVLRALEVFRRVACDKYTGPIPYTEVDIREVCSVAVGEEEVLMKDFWEA